MISFPSFLGLALEHEILVDGILPLFASVRRRICRLHEEATSFS